MMRNAWIGVASVCLLAYGLQAQTGVIRTIAGGGAVAGPAGAAFLDLPVAVVKDSAGNVYVALGEGEQVVKVDAAGQVTAVAGTGYAGYSGDGGPASQATLNLDNLYTELPTGLALDGAGNLYISDSSNNVVRKVNLATGIITTVAGNGTAGYSGDGGPATGAELYQPMGVAVDSVGNLYVADNNEAVRRVDASTGVISTVSGSAGLTLDGGIAVDAAGDIYISEPAVVQEISIGGALTTFAGNGNYGYAGDGGPAVQAELNSPSALALDPQGDLYIMDSANNAIRRVDAAGGDISTVAGNGIAGFSGDGGPAAQAELNPAYDGLYAEAAMAADAQGNLFFPDAYNMRVREVQAANGNIVTLAGGGTGSDGGPAANALLGFITGLEVDPQGDVYVHQAGDGRVRKLDSASGLLTTAVGDGIPVKVASTLSSGPAIAADLADANLGITDSAGNLYIADNLNNRVLRVDSASGNYTTVAGTGAICTSASIGDDGPATSACLTSPVGLAFDSGGDLYITERGGYRLRKVDSSGIITTVAGNGKKACAGDGGLASAAQLGSPTAVTVDGQGDIYISDCNDVRRIDASTGIITTTAGNGGTTFNGESGSATTIALGFNRGLSLDRLGNLFIADTQFNRVRRLDAYTGVLSTIAGSGSAVEGNGSFSGDGSLATAATLDTPYGVAVDGDNLLIGDSAANRVREVDLPPFLAFAPGSLDFGSQPVHTRTTLAVTIHDTGTKPLAITGISIQNDASHAFRIAGDGCGAQLASGASCTLNVSFRPHKPGSASATLAIASDAVFSTGSVPLTGTGVAGEGKH